MIGVLRTTWPLLLGVLLLLLGNGVQSTLLGIRGAMASFTTLQLSIVTSAYFLGFLAGSRLAPRLIQNVGHVRVFAALGSMISAVLVLYPMLVEWQLWTIMRVVIGFCFAGIYITAESWLNSTATNETRGATLSAYMIVQMIGIIAAQGLLAFGDPAGYELFIIPSVLVSFAFLPILLTKTPVPTFQTGERLGFKELFRISPLGCMGIIVSGGVFSAMLGMASVWGTLAGLSIKEIALFVSAIYIGGLIVQYPIGRMSDRMDRRKIMMVLSVVACITLLGAAFMPLNYTMQLIVALILGGVTYPMYSLLIAYTNDYLTKDQMAAASAGLMFLNGLGSIGGPLMVGWLMQHFGTGGFFLYMGLLYAIQVLFILWRMSTREPPHMTGSFVGINPAATPLANVAAIENAPELNTDQDKPTQEANDGRSD